MKVVLDRSGYALYFSRAPIPYPRDSFALNQGALPAGLPSYRHIGIYAYRVRFLKLYSRLEPAAMERFEALEQLRALWHGHRIAVAVTGTRRKQAWIPRKTWSACAGASPAVRVSI